MLILAVPEEWQWGKPRKRKKHWLTNDIDFFHRSQLYLLQKEKNKD